MTYAPVGQRPVTYWSYPTQAEIYPHGDESEPVPGWGAAAIIAGPARVGVGAVQLFTPETMRLLRRPAALRPGAAAPPPVAEPFPWLLVIAGTTVFGGGLALAYNMGWIGKKKRAG